ncbi:MAG: hypothetical protein IPG71_00240 [bacterium]|nr:hypothetical protein [bacterium]
MYDRTTSTDVPEVLPGTNWAWDLSNGFIPEAVYYFMRTTSTETQLTIPTSAWDDFQVAANYVIQVWPVRQNNTALTMLPIETIEITFGRIVGVPQPGEIPVILLHGVTANMYNWNWFTPLFSDDPQFQPFRVEYPNSGDIMVSAGLLKEAIGFVKSLSGATSVPIVSHSMGGLVARSYASGMAKNLNDVSVPYNNGDISRIVTIATPHRGGIANASVVLTYLTGDAAWEQLSATHSFIPSLNSHALLPIPSISIVGYNESWCRYRHCSGHTTCIAGFVQDWFGLYPSGWTVRVLIS